MEKSAFEITSRIQDSVQSLKYWQQEHIQSRYKCEQHLSPEIFKQFFNPVPLSFQITITGFVVSFWAIDALDCNFNKGDDLCGWNFLCASLLPCYPSPDYSNGIRWMVIFDVHNSIIHSDYLRILSDSDWRWNARECGEEMKISKLRGKSQCH